MSYTKAMKHWRNPRKYKKAQPIIFTSPSFQGVKSIHAEEKECSTCGYFRPTIFFTGDSCDMCEAVKAGANRETLSFFKDNTPEKEFTQ